MASDFGFESLQFGVEVEDRLRIALAELLDASDQGERKGVDLRADSPTDGGVPLVFKNEALGLGLGELAVPS